MIGLLVIDFILNQGFIIPSVLILINIGDNKYWKVLIIGILLDILLMNYVNTLVLSIIYGFNKIVKNYNFYLVNIINIFLYGLLCNVLGIWYLIVNIILIIMYKIFYLSYYLVGDEILIQKKSLKD